MGHNRGFPAVTGEPSPAKARARLGAVRAAAPKHLAELRLTNSPAIIHLWKHNALKNEPQQSPGSEATSFPGAHWRMLEIEAKGWFLR